MCHKSWQSGHKRKWIQTLPRAVAVIRKTLHTCALSAICILFSPKIFCDELTDCEKTGSSKSSSKQPAQIQTSCKWTYTVHTLYVVIEATWHMQVAYNITPIHLLVRPPIMLLQMTLISYCLYCMSRPLATTNNFVTSNPIDFLIFSVWGIQ